MKERVKFPDLKSSLRYAILGGTYGFFFICMFASLKTSSNLNTSIIYTSIPFITALFLMLGFQERTSKKRLSILTIALVGTLWVIFEGDLGKLLSLEVSEGDLIFFIGTISMGVHIPLVKKLYRGESIYHYTFYSLAFSSLILGVVLLFLDVDIAKETLSYSLDVWLGSAYLGIVTTAITFVIIQIVSQHLNPVNLIAYNYLVPIVVIIIDLILGESFPDIILIPGVLVTLWATYKLQRVRDE